MKIPDILQPATWKRYKPSNCKGCFAGCCTLPVKVDTEDLFHMGFINVGDVNGPKKQIARRLIKEGVLSSYNARSELFTLKRHRNHDCVFLDENRLCKIYERRPFVCRSFPQYSARPGFCPHQKFQKPKAL